MSFSNCGLKGSVVSWPEMRKNDGDMLQGRYHGVLVANGALELQAKLPERIYRASQPGALGVLEGLRRWFREDSVVHQISTPECVS